MSFLKRLGYAFGSLLVFIFACQDSFEFSTDSNDKLAFTTDTLRFDTVFTEVGSATRSFKIKNPTNKPLQISRIFLANKTSAIFNLNIDGVAGRSFKDVEILPNDSLYVFAEVTINPNAPLSISPFVISEDLVFETNGNSQKVVLEAWGQNANYIPSRFSAGGFALISGGNNLNTVVNFDDAKPYVIYGGLLLDSCIVRIAPGTRFYFHGGIGVFPDGDDYRDGIFIVQRNAKLEANGTLEKPIIFQSDRLESEFEKESDLWFGVVNSSERSGNVMTHTTIRNSRVGISVDSAANLTLRNCKIFNTGGSGLVASRARVTAENCLFYNTGGNAVQISYGGDYDFKYCTLSGIGSKEAALSLDNFRCALRDDFGQCVQGRVFRLNFSATNCAIYGSKEDEI
ncbi:MAG: right-handed parallel beta-helix repeat-containing protein, partial [Saprospiraceae bacterium]|nr:right-handed parallel beta-helix repeat-containing protein [Saprospiraceae bacterium]